MSKKFTITKDQLRQLTDPKIKEWFPEVFENKLEVGKWYVRKDGLYKTINFITSLKDMSNTGYGIDYLGNWVDSFDISGTSTDCLREATKEEVFKALVYEAEKIGFSGNQPINISSKNRAGYLANPSKNSFSFSNNILYLWEIEIFNNGIWATIIQTKTKAQAEKELNCKIID